MDKKLQKAIDLVEQAGGFVMFSEEELENIEKNSEVNDDYLQRKAEAFSEATHALYHKKSLCFEDIEDIMYENGMDMDEIENWIESQI